MVRTTDGILPLMTGSSASDHSDVASPPSLNENHFFHAANSFQSKPQQTEQHTVHYQFNQPSQQQQHHQQVEPSGQKFSSHKNPSSILPVDLCANVTTFPTQDMLLRVITLNCWLVSQTRTAWLLCSRSRWSYCPHSCSLYLANCYHLLFSGDFDFSLNIVSKESNQLLSILKNKSTTLYSYKR